MREVSLTEHDGEFIVTVAETYLFLDRDEAQAFLNKLIREGDPESQVIEFTPDPVRKA